MHRRMNKNRTLRGAFVKNQNQALFHTFLVIDEIKRLHQLRPKDGRGKRVHGDFLRTTGRSKQCITSRHFSVCQRTKDWTHVANPCQTAVLPIGSSSRCITTKNRPPHMVERCTLPIDHTSYATSSTRNVYVTTSIMIGALVMMANGQRAIAAPIRPIVAIRISRL